MIKEVDITSENPFGHRAEYYIDNKSVGFMEYSIIYDRMELDNIMVLEEYRGQGIGKKLMSYLVSEAILIRALNITLEVRISNVVARELYKKFGFREVALRKYYYGDEDGILMEKNVM